MTKSAYINSYTNQFLL